MQYVLAYKSIEGIKELVDRLMEDGYHIFHGLNHINELKDKVIGICVDMDTKNVFQLNITCMASWCGGYRKPLYVEEVLKNYDTLIVKKDFNLYDSLIIEGSKDKDRPSGGIYRFN